MKTFARTLSMGCSMLVCVAVACGGTGNTDADATNDGASGSLGGASAGSSAKAGASGTAGVSAGGATSKGGAGGGFVTSGSGGASANAGSTSTGGASGGNAGASAGGASGGSTAGGQGGQCQVGANGGTGGSTLKCGTKEICGNGFDDDCNGFIDEACPCTTGASQPCYAADPAEVGKGACKAGVQKCQGSGEFTGWGPCVGAVYATPEVCEGKVDENCDGTVDERCGCCPGTTEPCGSTVGACKAGTRTCLPSGVFGDCVGEVKPAAQETCGNKVDDNCNGVVDEGCVINVTVQISGDCVCSNPCPPQAPYPVGCSIKFVGDDPNGCVALAKDRVYFQEGDACGSGSLSGTLSCSSQQGAGLNAQNCPINKSKPKYGAKPSDCAKPSGTPDKCYF